MTSEAGSEGVERWQLELANGRRARTPLARAAMLMAFSGVVIDSAITLSQQACWLDALDGLLGQTLSTHALGARDFCEC